QDSMRVGMTPPGMLDPGWIYHLRFSLLHGLGLPLLAASLAGIVVMAWRRPVEALILGSFPAAYYLVAGDSANVFVRYMMPVIPFLCLSAAAFVDLVAGMAAGRLRMPRSAVAAVFALVIVAPT